MEQAQTLALTALTATLVFLSGCHCAFPDTREQMLSSESAADAEFPDGRDETLTSFAYLGSVRSRDGTLRVVSCRSVLSNMPAPRGKAWLAFFDESSRFRGRLRVDPLVTPLNCVGARVYFFGSQTNGATEGNALDLSDGVADARFVFVEQAGSWIGP